MYIANAPSVRMCARFCIEETKFVGFYKGIMFSTGFTFECLIIQQLLDYFVVFLQVISEFSALDYCLNNQIIEATMLTTQQEFICLTC